MMKSKTSHLIISVLLILITPPMMSSIDEYGTIRGQITVAHDTRDELMGRTRITGRYLSRTERSPESAAPIIPERYSLPEKVIIYLEPDESIRRSITSISSRRVILDQRNLMFYPHVLAIQRGTTVVFPNNDDVYHNVFSYSQPRQFDLGRYPRGQFRVVQFNTPGVVRIYCDIHAHMNAVILVLDNPYFTSPDESGNYSIPEVPAGRYTVHFWYGRNLVESRNVEITPGSVSIINFSY
jgi:plastocyanin